MGRTVRSGTLYLDGSPVNRTSFASDALNPVAESHIPSLLRSRLEAVSIVPREAANANDAIVYVIDGETEEDVRITASALAPAAGLLLAAGPAAFAGYFAEYSPRARKGYRREAFASAHPERCLVVNGSRHPVAHQQVSVALSQGWSVCGPEMVTAGTLRAGWTILKLPVSPEDHAAGFAARIAHTVREILSRVELDAMVVLGGDTAYQILAALGHPPLVPEGELVPGVPVSRVRAEDLPSGMARSGRDFSVITKAGGFGSPDVLLRIRECANPKRRS
jgi:uncharacterized protein YgbK (DUF1537 family)